MIKSQRRWTRHTFTVPFQEAAIVPPTAWSVEYSEFVISCYRLLHFVAFWSKRSRHRADSKDGDEVYREDFCRYFGRVFAAFSSGTCTN